MKLKPTILIGIGEIGCDVVELCRKRLIRTNPEEVRIIRALGIELEAANNSRKRDFHVENLSGFVPTKITQRSFAEKKDDLLSWFHSNMNKERLARLNEIIQSDPFIRPLGRLALFLKASIIQKILENFIHDIRLIWKQNEEPIHLIIISPMSDGLGSGAIIDLSFIIRAAANSEKASVNIIAILIAEPSIDQNKNKQLKEADSYALLMEVSFFQDRRFHYKKLMQKDTMLSEDGKIFNLCYLFNISKDYRTLDETMRSRLSRGIELLILSPQDSARRIMADQVGTAEVNFGCFGTAVLRNNIDDVVSICSKKLSSELLKLILGENFEKEAEKKYLYLNIEDFTPVFIENFEKKYDSNLSTLSKVPWKKIKKIKKNDLNTLRDNILNEHAGDFEKVFENHFDGVKETLFTNLQLQYMNLLSTPNEGFKGSRMFLEEISGKLELFYNQVEKNVRDMDRNINDTSENFDCLFAKIKQASKWALVELLMDLFNKEWRDQKKELVERFNFLLNDYVKKDFKSRLWKSSCKFYNEIQSVVKNIDVDVRHRGIILNPLSNIFEKEIVEEIDLMSSKKRDWFPIFEAKHIELIYKKYKPKNRDLLDNFRLNNPDFWALIEDNDIDKLKSAILSTCKRYFNHLCSIDITGFLQDESVLSLKEILTRIYSLSSPKIEDGSMDINEFYERIIIMSGIHECWFKNIKEEVCFDSELIFEDKLSNEITMVREWYGIKLSKVPMVKDWEPVYIQLRKEDFPLHTVDKEQCFEIPFISYPVKFFNNMKRVFLVGMAMKCIDIRNGVFWCGVSDRDEIELGTGKESAFLSFIENPDICQWVEECINRRLIDKSKENLRKSMKAFFRESDRNLFTGKEIEVIGKFYEEAISI